MSTNHVTLTVNGEAREADVEPLARRSRWNLRPGNSPS